MISYYGQGEPLPPDFAYQGQWLADNVFLYANDAHALRSDAPRFTARARTSDGEIHLGFSVDQVAHVLGVTPEDVLVANRNGTLTASIGERPAPTPSGTQGIRYVFRIGSRVGSLTVAEE